MFKRFATSLAIAAAHDGCVGLVDWQIRHTKKNLTSSSLKIN